MLHLELRDLAPDRVHAHGPALDPLGDLVGNDGCGGPVRSRSIALPTRSWLVVAIGVFYRLVIFGPTYTTYSGVATCTGHEK